MNAMKSLLICLSFVCLAARAETPDAAAASKPTLKAQQAAAEKSVLADASKHPSKSEASTVDFCQCVGQDDNAATKRIERALSAPLHKIGLDYADQPLEDIVTQLSEEYGIPLQLDIAALEAAGIGTDSPVTINLHNISLRSAVRLMLKPKQLTYVIEDEVLYITTTAEAEKNLKICVYDVRKISEDKVDILALMDTISSCVARDTWIKNGKGSAEIRSPRPGFLVITQSQAAHNDIRNLLTTLDEMRRDHQAEISSAPTKDTTGGSTDRYAPATPPAPVVPRKPATIAHPPKGEAAPGSPFGS